MAGQAGNFDIGRTGAVRKHARPAGRTRLSANGHESGASRIRARLVGNGARGGAVVCGIERFFLRGRLAVLPVQTRLMAADLTQTA